MFSVTLLITLFSYIIGGAMTDVNNPLKYRKNNKVGHPTPVGTTQLTQKREMPIIDSFYLPSLLKRDTSIFQESSGF